MHDLWTLQCHGDLIQAHRMSRRHPSQKHVPLCILISSKHTKYCLHLMLPFLPNEWKFLIYVDERGGNKKRDRQDKVADYSLQTWRKTDRRNLLGKRPMNPAKVWFLLAGPFLTLLKLPFLLPFSFLLSSLSSSSSFSCHRKFSQSLADGSSAWEGGGGTCVYEYVRVCKRVCVERPLYYETRIQHS